MAESDKLTGKSLTSSLNKGKFLLEKATGRKSQSEGQQTLTDESIKTNQESSSIRESATSSATAMVTKVKKAAQATKNSVNKMVPHTKSPLASESGSERLVGDDVPSEQRADLDSSSLRKGDSPQRNGSNLSVRYNEKQYLLSPVVKFSKHMRNKRKSDVEADTASLERRDMATVDSTVMEMDATVDTKAPPEAESDAFSVSVSENESLGDSRRDSALTFDFSSPPRGKIIDVGPFLSFFLRDSSLVVGASLIMATVPTVLSWDLIVQNQIPISVSLAWLVVAFLLGRELERVYGSGEVLPGVITIETDSVADEATPRVVVKSMSSRHQEEQPKDEHTIFMKATENLKKVRFRLAGQKKTKKPRKRFWTNLSRPKQLRVSHWERNIRSPKSRSLMAKMYQDPSLRRMSIPSATDEAPVNDDDQEILDRTVGTFDLSNLTADTLAGCVVEPMFDLRGMDVFLTGEDGADDNVGTHPFLIEGGLRDKKTFLVNIMLQWANVLIYFEMPDWIESFDCLVEKEDDPDDVKALKRFINGDDEYRNQRLKIIPSLVDGPRIIKMLSPPKKELTVCTAILPVSWNQHHGSTEPDGTKQQPMMEAELDCMAVKAMRGMANIVKRNLSGVVIDLAAVIQKPDGAAEDEPSACLGMWRFDRVEIDSCPMLPERKIEEEEVIRRASVMVGLSPEELKVIEDED